MSSSIDQQFIEYIVKSLVSKPDAVKIERRIDEKGVLLELTVDPEDLGRVIGKRGATAQSLRTLLRALGTKNDARYNLKIIDNGEPRPSRDTGGTVDDAAAATDDTTPDVLQEDSGAEEALDKDVTGESVAEVESEAASDENAEEESVADRTRKELAEFDDLDV